ncbi:hypothetical protein NUW58_g7091 [Xylaria curta]|uniref:Uncharacterized protein n=1 Tax=Xylaria curta TaxID=42375 RepID=A0ACC1NM25_9PEZI|nr:hypothetical protein NUW58_g7091 [Xylaria curta]
MEGPEPTAAPALENGGGERTIVADGRKFVQTTYWACETFPKETHCGWHEPILDALALINYNEHIHLPVTQARCTLECYKHLMELPAVCAIQHTPSCECRDPDSILVREYIEKRYADGVENGQLTSEGLRFFQQIIHELCNEFRTIVEGGFGAPANVPDPSSDPIPVPIETDREGRRTGGDVASSWNVMLRWLELCDSYI